MNWDKRLKWGPINFHTSKITYCPLQRHLVDSRFKEDNSGCRNVNKFPIKGCFLMNLCNLLSAGYRRF